jgi:hypothetical protein
VIDHSTPNRLAKEVSCDVAGTTITKFTDLSAPVTLIVWRVSTAIALGLDRPGRRWSLL